MTNALQEAMHNPAWAKGIIRDLEARLRKQADAEEAYWEAEEEARQAVGF